MPTVRPSSPATTTRGPKHVQIRLYDLHHLRPGDQVTSGGSLYQITGTPAGGGVLGADLLAPSRPDKLLHLDHLGPHPHIRRQPGRTGGLQTPFWNASQTPASAIADPTQPDPPYTGAEVALTCGGGVRLRHREGHADTLVLSLSVPGCELSYGRSSSPPRTLWWGLPDRLETAAALDGGLSAAGRTLALCVRSGHLHLPTMWTAMLGAHLGLAPYPSVGRAALSAAHHILAELGPTWTRPVEQLGAILADLTSTPARR